MTRVLREGKTKLVLETDDPNLVLLRFKNVVTARDGACRNEAPGKAALNAATSAVLFDYLNKQGIPTHYIKQHDERTLLVRRLEMIPLEVVCRNIATGSLVRRLAGFFEKGQRLTTPLIEYYLKCDELHDPWVNEDHVTVLGLASREELQQIRSLTLAVNTHLSRLFTTAGLQLVDFKLEFGRDPAGELRIGDELSGDVMRVWTPEGESLDKDVYRRGGSVNDLLRAYRTLQERIRSAVRNLM